jgi:DNA polymerase-4
MILHVDMDAFYASIEQRDRPELRGLPVIVGGSAGNRGVVSAASYEARKFGVHSAMPSGQARRLCPQAVFLPVRMEHYARVARHIREILLGFTPVVEPLSLDEAFLDVQGSVPLFGPPVEISAAIKARIRRETELIASVGVAPNKFLAKLASDLGKPDGLFVIEPDRVQEVLDPLPVSRLWGVGTKSEKRLHALGLKTIGHIAAMPEPILVDHLGEVGSHLARLARGEDDRCVVPDHEAKSISSETTFPRDIASRAILRSWLLELTEEVAQRLRHGAARARTVDIKVRSGDFRTCTRSATLNEPTDATQTIWEAARRLFDTRVPATMLPTRLIGVGVSNLQRDGLAQSEIFDEAALQKLRAVDRATDAIKARFGDGAVKRGGALDR